MLGSRRARCRCHKADKLMIQMTILSLSGMWRKFECLVRRKFRQDSGQRSYLSRGSSRQVRQNIPIWLVRLRPTAVFATDMSCSYWSQLASCTSRTALSVTSACRILGNILDMFHRKWRRPRIDEFQQDKACSLAGLPDPDTSLSDTPDTAFPHSLPSSPLDMSHIASPPLH